PREEVALDQGLLHDRLDHEIDLGEVVEMRAPLEAREHRTLVGGRQLSALDVLGELLLDLAARAVERARRRLGEDGLEAGARGGRRDAEPHLARADDTDAPDLHRSGATTTFEPAASIRAHSACGGPLPGRSAAGTCAPCPTQRATSSPPRAP